MQLITFYILSMLISWADNVRLLLQLQALNAQFYSTSENLSEIMKTCNTGST
jgi:hypothetical protein